MIPEIKQINGETSSNCSHIWNKRSSLLPISQITKKYFCSYKVYFTQLAKKKIILVWEPGGRPLALYGV